MDFNIKNGVLEQYTGQDVNVVVPDGVVEIGKRAFNRRMDIKSVKLPDGLKIIGVEAFYLCTRLEDINIPEGVTEIKNDAFNNCNSIKQIILPDSLQTIGSGAFDGCRGLDEIRILKSLHTIRKGFYSRFVFGDLKKVTVDPGNPFFCSIDGILYNADKTEIVSIPLGVAGEIHIPEGLEEIPDAAFRGMKEIERVILPETLKAIGRESFAKTGITDITIPNSVTEIGKCAFMECSKLSIVTLPEKITEIPEGMCLNCEALKEVKSEALTKIGARAFEKCRELRSINISDKASIEASAFSTCTELADSNGFIIINKMLFDYVGDSTEVVVPDEVEIIKTGALMHSKVKQVKLPETIKLIEDNSLNAYNLL